MKPVNNYLGVYPTRISRVTGLDVATRSLDSVVFQQGKSIKILAKIIVIKAQENWLGWQG